MCVYKERLCGLRYTNVPQGVPISATHTHAHTNQPLSTTHTQLRAVRNVQIEKYNEVKHLPTKLLHIDSD